MAELITAEQGGTRELARVFQAASGSTSFNYYAEVARRYPFEEVRESDLGSYAGSAGAAFIPMAGKSLIVREPRGVVAVLPAYNVAVPSIGQKAGPALAAGCTVVVKVPEQNPLASLAVGRIAEKIGFPPGVLNIVAGVAQSSAYLVAHPGVDMVTFTGSTSVGRSIAAVCADLVRPVVLELGGKSAAIVLEDADPAETARALTDASVAIYSGQACHAQTRFLVPAERYDEYADLLAAAFEELKVGDPWDQDTVVGPLISERHRDAVEAHIARAKEQGAKIRSGGSRPDGLEDGWYLQPTLIADVTNDMDIAQEELFGPVVALIAYSSEAEAIQIANDSKYGLAGSVYTADLRKGFEIARQIETGTFSINGLRVDMGSPFGGYKQSGLGREHGPWAIDEFLQTKTINIDPTQDFPAEIISGRLRGAGPGTATAAVGR